MKQVTLVSRETFAFSEAAIPEPGKKQALIKVKAVGICGSDIHAYYGEHPFIGFPIVLGHEVAGEVVKLGEGASKLKAGDRVVLRPQDVCGKCHMCKTNRYNICRELQVLGCQLTGASSDYYAADEDLFYKIPDQVDYDVATIIEPLAVGVHAVKRCGDIAGQNVVVIGAGPIGNVVAQSAKGLGAKAVLISDIADFKLDVAKQCGIDYTVNVLKEDMAEAVNRYFGEDGVDLVLECSANEKALNLALEYARKGTNIIIVGVYGKANVNMANVQDREYGLIGSLMYLHEDFMDAVRLLEEGKVNLQALLSKKYPLEQVADAYKYIESNTDTVLKVVLDV